MKKTELDEKMQELQNEQQWRDIQSNARRARSISVGTVFGGTTEVAMRGDGDSRLWCLLAPVEVIELIHQLAANVGCHIQVQPRDDFSSWRGWRVTDAEREHLKGRAPFVDDMAPHAQVGANLPPPEKQPGYKIETPVKEQQDVVATKKTVNRRITKRATKAP